MYPIVRKGKFTRSWDLFLGFGTCDDFKLASERDQAATGGPKHANSKWYIWVAESELLAQEIATVTLHD